MSRISIALYGFLLCAVAMAQPSGQSVLGAQDFVPAPGQAFSIDLDTPAGRFSQWLHEDVRTLISLRAFVRVLLLRKDPRWRPAFTIYLQSRDDESSANDLGLQLAAVDQKPPLTIRLIGRLNGKPIKENRLQTTLNLDETLRVDMNWRTPKVIVIRIGDAETLNVGVPWSVSKVKITGSTGEMTVDPLLFAEAVP